MHRLSDAYADLLMDGIDRLCQALDELEHPDWQALVRVATPLMRKPNGDYGQGMLVAVASNRAVLLEYGHQQLDRQVERARTRLQDPALAKTMLPLSAGLLAMVLADLIDAAMFDRLMAPLRAAAVPTEPGDPRLNGIACQPAGP